MTKTKIKGPHKRDVSYYLNLPYTVVLRADEEGNHIAKIQELPGCIAHGESQEEALERVREAQELWLADCLESGDVIPEPEPEEDLPSGKWLQRVPRSLHKNLAERAKKENVSLNQLVLSMLSSGLATR